MDCSQTMVAMTQFLDPACKNVKSQITTLSPVCTVNTDDDSGNAMNTDNFSSGVCGQHFIE